MVLVDKLDELGRPAWIALVILGFMAWWPVGLAVLAFFIGSGRMGCWHHYDDGKWQHHMGRWQSKMERMQEKMDRMRTKMDARGGGELVGDPAIERQPRVRRLSHRNAAPARRGAARVQGIPGAAALCQGPLRVRSVHGRTARSPPGRKPAAASRRLKVHRWASIACRAVRLSPRRAARAFLNGRFVAGPAARH